MKPNAKRPHFMNVKVAILFLILIQNKGVQTMEEVLISLDECEILDAAEYSHDIDSHFINVPEIAKPLISKAKQALQNIEKYLYTTPSFINAIKALIPEESFQAILTDEQKSKIAAGALKLMTKKDGSLLATLIDPKTSKIVSTIPLKSIKVTPELTQSMINYASQMQMAQLSEQIRLVQLAIEEVRQGQENDRLALAYSCQQKLLQAMAIKSPEIRTNALLRVASDAEDSRNMLMLSQKVNIEFIKAQPENDVGKLFHGATSKKIETCINEMRESLNVVNMVSLVEAMAFQDLGEMEAARQSLVYYADFIKDAYLSTEGFVQRLDMIDTFSYWS